MSLLSKFIGKKQNPSAKNPAEVYLGLRHMILTKRPPSFQGFWGIVMDVGVSNGSATMIAVADGTVSMYTSSGGGIIGVAAHERPKRVAAELLQFAPQFSKYCQETSEFPLPWQGVPGSI